MKDTLNTGIFMRKQYHLIIMRDQNPPPPMTNMLNRLTTRHTLYSQHVESGNYINIIFTREENPTPSDQYAEWANNTNVIFMRDQNSPPPQNNMLIGKITSTLSLHEGSKLATPSEQYVDCGTSTPGKRPGCSQ